MLPASDVALTARLGRPCWYHPSTGSTNDDAAVLARAGAPHGSLVLADSQERGRGRLGRSWFSPPEHNLYFSMILRPRTAPADTALITLAAGVAIAEALELRLKWPNDVLDTQHRKVAGLLSEMDVAAGRVSWVILGIGLNVNQPSFPPELPEAASLRMVRGEPQDRLAVLAQLLPALDRRVEQIHGEREELGRAWTALSATTGRRVHAGALEGVAEGLRSDGALWVRTDDGTLHAVVAGDVLLANG